MEGKGFKIVTIVLIVLIIIALGLGTFFIFHQQQKQEDLENEVNTLKQSVKNLEDNVDELNYNIDELMGGQENVNTEISEAEKEEIVQMAFEKYIEESAEDTIIDYSLDEYRIDNVEIEYMLEGQEYEDSITATVTYSVKPATDESYNNWVAGNGEDSGEWIINKTAICEVALTAEGYTVVNAGTGW